MEPNNTKSTKWKRVCQAAKIVWFCLKVIVTCLPPSLEVFLHHGMGVRYLPRIVAAFLLFLFYAWCARTSNPADRFFLKFYGVSFFMLCCYHVIGHLTAHLGRSQPAHSCSSGMPRLSWQGLNLRPALVAIYVEPILCFGFASLISYQARTLSFWIKLSSVALFIKGHVEWWLRWRHIQNAMDGRIESREINEAVEERMAAHGSDAHSSFTAAPSQPRETKL